MMWNLDTNHGSQSQSRQALNPARHQGNVTFPPGTPSYMSMPSATASSIALQPPFAQLYPQQQSSVPTVVPHNIYQVAPQTTQIIIIEESRRRHHESRHETHLHSAESVQDPQSVTSSTLNAPTRAEYLAPCHETDHHSHHRHSSPHYHSDSHHYSDTHYHSDPHRHSHQHTGSDHHLNSRHYMDDLHHHSGSYYHAENSSYRPNPEHSAHRHSDKSTSHIKLTRPRIQQYSQPPSAITSARHSGDEFMYSKCTGRKKALCIGINYRGQSHQLQGCINDAHVVRKWLRNYHGFKTEDIVLLADDTSEPRYLPTRENMLNAMKWLVRSARPHDSLFFHYSGHGGQVKDLDGDEVDGFDQVIFPLDYKKEGVILDDDLHDIMVHPLPAGCRLTALFDSCHSGTVLDLPYIFTCEGLRKNDITPDWIQKKTSCADVISWSACKDGETSVDTFKNGIAVGAMSNAFISVLKEQPNQSYRELLHSVRAIVGPKYDQTPQLGSSHPKDMSHRFIV